MCKDKTGKGTQQTRMDQYTVQTLGGTLPQEPPGPLNKGSEPTGAQALAAIEASGKAVKSQSTAMAVDVNLLRADLRVVAERSVATEQQVTSMQIGIDTLKISVAALEVKTRKMELRVEDAEGRALIGRPAPFLLIMRLIVELDQWDDESLGRAWGATSGYDDLA
ncbi:hypothetical protein NDU88_010446 [Pleurodeles waltl]|uniref:Uncharacterized protein n=1 Tax=Pleurodeles waltl TaxID=8319 RepID=A0AAV7RY89_PLEWA|nr:hypothetical protein NDU88_010446 [Pleurodeles waltl]